MCRRAWRCDVLQIGQPAQRAGISVSNSQDLAKRVGWNRRRHRRSARRRIFHPAQADFRGSPLDGLIDRAVGHEEKVRRSVQPPADELGDSTSNPVNRRDRPDRPRQTAPRLQDPRPRGIERAGRQGTRDKGQEDGNGRKCHGTERDRHGLSSQYPHQPQRRDGGKDEKQPVELAAEYARSAIGPMNMPARIAGLRIAFKGQRVLRKGSVPARR